MPKYKPLSKEMLCAVNSTLPSETCQVRRARNDGGTRCRLATRASEAGDRDAVIRHEEELVFRSERVKLRDNLRAIELEWVRQASTRSRVSTSSLRPDIWHVRDLHLCHLYACHLEPDGIYASRALSEHCQMQWQSVNGYILHRNLNVLSWLSKKKKLYER